MRNFTNPVEQVDVPRIREAFDTLVDKCHRWPSPALFYRALPPRPQRAALPMPEVDEQGMEEGRKHLQLIYQTLKIE